MDQATVRKNGVLDQAVPNIQDQIHADKGRGIGKYSRPFFLNLFVYPNFENIFAPALGHGTLAQLVEQRTENPCVPGSIPGDTTENPRDPYVFGVFLFWTGIIVPLNPP